MRNLIDRLEGQLTPSLLTSMIKVNNENRTFEFFELSYLI